ncbi:MAG: hypothetical protein Q7J19_06350 [Lutibacter sp.]|nr:hypothetical protein [Lutibacter sp.]
MKNIERFKKIITTFKIKNLIKSIGLSILALQLLGCSSKNNITGMEEQIEYPTFNMRLDFDDLNGWTNASQNMKGVVNYAISDGLLNIFTRANTWDRPKIKTLETYTTGKYTWRVFVPEMGVGDKASIGAFLYFNDSHELDFEIGYGKALVRQNLNAEVDDLLLYTNSQGHPFKSEIFKIKRNQWYTLEIDLLLVNNKYQAVWYINNTELYRLNLEYGKSIAFHILCSVENLTFIGDHIPTQNNYAIFDYVEFKR